MDLVTKHHLTKSEPHDWVTYLLVSLSGDYSNRIDETLAKLYKNKSTQRKKEKEKKKQGARIKVQASKQSKQATQTRPTTRREREPLIKNPKPSHESHEAYPNNIPWPILTLIILFSEMLKKKFKLFLPNNV